VDEKSENCRSLVSTSSVKVKLTSDNFDEWSSNGTNSMEGPEREREVEGVCVQKRRETESM
jgi:hypothetical protein